MSENVTNPDMLYIYIYTQYSNFEPICQQSIYHKKSHHRESKAAQGYPRTGQGRKISECHREMIAQRCCQGRARDCICCSQNMNNLYPSRNNLIEARKGLTWYSNGLKRRHTARKVLFEARKDFDGDVGQNLCMRTYSNMRILHESEQSGRRKGAQEIFRGTQGFGARHNQHKHVIERKSRKAAQGLAQGWEGILLARI